MLTKFNQKLLKRRVKLLWCAHLFIHSDLSLDEIANLVKVKPKKLRNWMRSKHWYEALDFWGNPPNAPKSEGDLALAERIWQLMFVEKQEFPINFPQGNIRTIAGSNDCETAEQLMFDFGR